MNIKWGGRISHTYVLWVEWLGDERVKPDMTCDLRWRGRMAVQWGSPSTKKLLFFQSFFHHVFGFFLEPRRL